MTLLMKINGVKGNVTSQGYEGWIQLSSMDNGIKRNMATKVGKTSDRESSMPSFQEIEITKDIDASTPTLYQYACEGHSMTNVGIHACSTGQTLSPYVKYQLSNVIVSSYHEALFGDEQPFEKIMLNFTKIQKTYISRDSQNKPQSPITFGFDLEKAQKL